jgi:hypothetical protein
LNLIDAIFGNRDNAQAQQTVKEEEDKLCAFVKSRVDESRNSASRIAHEGVWMTNIAALLGYTSVYYDTTTRQFLPTGANRGVKRNRIHVNKILPTVQNRLARLSKNRPKYQTKPNSSDNEDKEAARLAEKVLDMIWHKESLDTKRLELLMWLQQCGHAYLKPSWDPSFGEELPQAAMTAESMVEYEGDIRVDVVSPFEVFPDPLAKTERDAQYMVQAKVRKLDYFQNQYGEKGAQVKAEDVWLLSAQYEQRINNIGTQGPSSGNSATDIPNSAIELCYYERRSKQHPQGRMIIVANGVLLENKPLPVGVIPLVKFDDILVAGKYYSESIITHLRPIQEQYNRIIQKRAEWANRLLAGKWMTARGHGLSQESLNDQSGEVLEYDPVPNALPPSPVPLPSIPQYAYTEEQALDTIMNDISGINDVSRGQAPSAQLNATAFQYLSEQDDTRIAIVSKRIEEGMARFGGLVLRYAGKYYKTPRLLKIAGQNMEYTVQSFVGADLKNNYDVSVVEGSTLPGSTAHKREFILDLASKGYLGDPADPRVSEKVMKLIEFGDVAELWEDYGLDMNQIKKATEELKKGVIPPVNELDNHSLFVQELNRFRKTDEFDALEPEIKAGFLDYIEAHIQAEINLQNPDLEIEQQTAADMEASPTLEETQGMEGLPQEPLPVGGPI